MIAKVPDHVKPQDPEKDGSSRTPSAKVNGDPAGQGFGAYGNGRIYDRVMDLSPENWKHEAKTHANEPWVASLEGRLAIRCFARGVMGCAFFALGKDYAGWAMRGSNIGGREYAGYHPDAALSDSHWAQMPARFAAKLFDTVAGKPIQYAVHAITGDAEAGVRAVTFRPTNSFSSGLEIAGRRRGRSLGHEVVGVTFDFATMSVGDGLGQDIAGLFDPNVTKSWLKEGKINYPALVKRMASNTFRYLTYNAGEDWAVALPYVYYIRAQRNLIDHFSPGFKYDSDRSLNGGSMKVNDHGQVVGNYNIEGALDLQGRFTAYNIGTLMFREGYLGTGKKLVDWYDAGMHVPKIDTNPATALESAYDWAKSTARWAARDVVKGAIYMTPAVPFFWATRTPQSKHRGLFIHPEHGAVSYMNSAKFDTTRGTQGYHDLVHANELRHKHVGDFSPETPVYFRHFDDQALRWHGEPSDGRVVNQFTPQGYDPYARTFGKVDKVFNTLGSVSNDVRRAMHRPIYKTARSYGYDWNTPHGSDLGHVAPKLVNDANWWKDLSNTYSSAAVSYTPYFFAKTDMFSKLWDHGRTDVAIERAIDGATSLNMGEFGAGCSEIWQSLKGGPLKDPKREAAAQDAIRNDVSPPDVFAPPLLSADYMEQRGAQKKFTKQVEAERKENPQGFKTPDEQPDKPHTAAHVKHASFVDQVTDRDHGAPPGATIH